MGGSGCQVKIGIIAMSGLTDKIHSQESAGYVVKVDGGRVEAVFARSGTSLKHDLRDSAMLERTIFRRQCLRVVLHVTRLKKSRQRPESVPALAPNSLCTCASHRTRNALSESPDFRVSFTASSIPKINRSAMKKICGSGCNYRHSRQVETTVVFFSIGLMSAEKCVSSVDQY